MSWTIWTVTTDFSYLEEETVSIDPNVDETELDAKLSIYRNNKQRVSTFVCQRGYLLLKMRLPLTTFSSKMDRT